MVNLRQSIFEFSMSLHNDSSLTRKHVVNVQNEITSKIVGPMLNIISDTILPHITDQNKINDFQLLLNKFSKPFDFISSEHRLFSQLESNDLLERPKMFTINNEFVDMIVNGEPTIDSENIQGCMMPIEFQIKKYFETSSILSETLENMRRLEQSNSIANFVNGSFWKEINNII